MITEEVTMTAIGHLSKHKLKRNGIDIGMVDVYDFVVVNGKKYKVTGHRFIAPVFDENGKFSYLIDADTHERLKVVA